MNMSLYDKFTSKENLKTAFFYLKEEIDHSTLPLDPISKPTLNAITELGDEFFDALAKYLQNGHYKPGRVDYTFAQKDNLSLRPICVLSVIDRIIYQALLNPLILGNAIDKKLLSYCFGNRILGKETYFGSYKPQWSKFCQKQIEAFEEGYKWRSEFDIKTFFEEIIVSTLISILRDKFFITDQSILDLLENQLTIWTEKQQINLGIPQGAGVSHVLANAYLYPLDTFMNDLMGDKTFKYFRYIDGIVVMARDSNSLNRIIEKASLFLRQYNLDLNEKTKLEKLKNTNSIKELKFYDSYGTMNITSKQKVRKIEKKLTKIFKKIKNGTELEKLEKSSLNYYLKASSAWYISDRSDEFIEIIPHRPYLIHHITNYLLFYLSGFFKVGKKVALSRYNKLWNIYKNNSLSDWTKFWLLKALSIPEYAVDNEEFQSELDKILTDKDAKLLRIVALSYKAYVQEYTDKSISLDFTIDDIRRYIVSAKTDAEKAVYYYFIIYLKDSEETETITEMVHEALQAESSEIQLIGLYLAKQLSIKPILDRTGSLSKLYLKLPPDTKEGKSIEGRQIQSKESDYLNFEGKIAKDQFAPFLGFSKSRYANAHVEDSKKPIDEGVSGFPLELTLAGKVLRIEGYVFKEPVDLITIQAGGSAALLDPIFKICRSQQTSWKIISKKKIEATVGYDKISSFQEILKDLSTFSKYTSGIGLKGALRSLFIGKINDQTGIKIRIAVSTKDWNNLPTKKQEDDRLTSLISKIDEEEQRYAKAYGSGSLDFEQFKDLMRDAKKRKLIFQTHLNSLKLNTRDEDLDKVQVDDICYKANKVLNEIEYTDKSRSIKTLVDKVIIKEGGWVQVCGHIPLFIQKLGDEPTSWNCGVTKCGEKYAF